MNTKYLLNFKDLIEVYDEELDKSLENISWSTDSSNGKVEICRCTKYQKQDPEFVVFKDEVIMGGVHYYILPGSVDLFKSVFPNGTVGNPFINFSEDDKFKKFSDRLNKCFGLTRIPDVRTKLSDFYEVKDGKIICDNIKEVREVVDKMVELDDWSVEIVCNFEDANFTFLNRNYKDLSKLKLDTSKVTSMQCMFKNCKTLRGVPKLDTSNVINSVAIFMDCNALKKLGYPINDNKKMLEIVSTTVIDGKPYKG